MLDITRSGCPILRILPNKCKIMEIAIPLICLIFILYYLFRPTSKKEKDQFDDKNNWRGGF